LPRSRAHTRGCKKQHQARQKLPQKRKNKTKLKAEKKSRRQTDIKRQAKRERLGSYEGKERVIDPFFPLIKNKNTV